MGEALERRYGLAWASRAGTFYLRTRGLPRRTNGTREIVANAEGEFFIVGECDGQICVYIFRPDGVLDTGLCIDDVDGDGNISAASDGLAILRNMLNVPANANVPTGHGYDDGDGALNASRGGLLLVRRMLGFTDVAVLSGIAFASHARRTTWPQIESYLRKRCRIPRAPVTAPERDSDSGGGGGLTDRGQSTARGSQTIAE